MTFRLPAIPVRVQVTDVRTGRMSREWLEFFNGMRLSVGGDRAQLDPGAQADAFDPVALGAFVAAGPSPVSVSTSGVDAVPMAVCNCPSEVLPV